MSNITIAFTLAIAGLAAIVAITTVIPLYTKQENEAIQSEIINIANAIREVRRVHRADLTGAPANFAALVQRGYLDDNVYPSGATDSSTSESIINTNISANPSTAANGTLTYDAGDANTCEWIEDRVNEDVLGDNIAVGTACTAAGVIVLNIE